MIKRVLDLSKLYCTFCQKDNVEDTIRQINKSYSVIHNKVFVLESPQSEEYICTYNIDSGNINNLIPGTILMHRKKESNTLYTINALNSLISVLNNGILDKSFPIAWEQYKNSILLTQSEGVRQLSTSIHRVVRLN